MKKISALLLAVVMAFGMAGCSDSGSSDIKTTRYCATDKIYHTIYTRITKVVSKSEDADYVNKAIELNNSVGSDFSKIDESELKIPDDCELCVMEYEVYKSHYHCQ